MSEDQAAAQETSSEDKFFGVKTTITGPDSDVDVEVVDDRPQRIAGLLRIKLKGRILSMKKSTKTTAKAYRIASRSSVFKK